MQLPVPDCAVNVETLMVQLELFEEYVTAPVPKPPVVLSVLVPRYATVDGLANAFRVDWLAFVSVTMTVPVATR